MKRKRMRPSKDKSVFRNTAMKTKSVNLVNTAIPRGGIRF